MHESVFARSHARMHDHASGFVDRQQVLVLVDHVDRNRNRLQLGRNDLRQGEVNPVTRIHLVALADDRVISSNQAGLECTLQGRPAVRRKCLCQHLVSARAADFLRNRVRGWLQTFQLAQGLPRLQGVWQGGFIFGWYVRFHL